MPALSFLFQPGRDMDYSSRILVFISMLAAFASTTKPFDFEIIVRALRIGNVGRRTRVEHRYRNGTRMNTASTLRRRYPLKSVTASFRFKPVEIVAGYFNGDLVIADIRTPLPDDAVLSALFGEEPFISVSEIRGQQLGVGTALGGMDFYNTNHVFFSGVSGLLSSSTRSCTSCMRSPIISRVSV